MTNGASVCKNIGNNFGLGMEEHGIVDGIRLWSLVIIKILWMRSIYPGPLIDR